MSTWVLLRGLTRESRHWGALPALLAEPLPGARVLALDLPGNGRLNDQPSASRVEAMVEHLRAALAAAGHAPPYELLAMSLGGMVAIAWAASYPRELAGAVLVNTSVGRLQPFHQRLRPRAWLPLLGLLVPGQSAEQREHTVLRLTSARHASAAAPPIEWVDIHRSHPVSPRNAVRQLLAALRFVAPSRAPDVPLLLLVSARDRLVDPRCSRRLAQAWGSAMAEHPDAGHDLPFDDPTWLIDQLADWQTTRSSAQPRSTNSAAHSSPPTT